MGYRVVIGKKCVIYHNSKDDRYQKPRGETFDRLTNPQKEFEVFKCDNGDSGSSCYFPLDTPYYSREGYDTLEEAKIFFLLMEI